jgi:acyl-coenzyme A synthetase/AMP-(fatty) acid ligase
VLEEHPLVQEAAVVGASDAHRGEVPMACVVLRTNEGTPDVSAILRAYCQERLASFKVPRAFEVVERLPRNALGKLQKHLLKR